MNRDALGVFVRSYDESTQLQSRSHYTDGVGKSDNPRPTFHVSFSLVHDKRVALALALAIADDSDPLNVAVHFELSPQVGLGGLLRLRGLSA
jgi:hypothetical protein